MSTKVKPEPIKLDSIKKILEANIADARFPISEEDLADIKVEFSNSVKLMEKQVTSWLTDKDTLYKYIFIQGKAGTGKSTWLYYYAKKETLNGVNVQFDIINMNAEESGLGTEQLVRDNFLSKLLSEVEEQLYDCKDDIKKIVNNGEDHLHKYFVHDRFGDKKTKQLILFEMVVQ